MTEMQDALQRVNWSMGSLQLAKDETSRRMDWLVSSLTVLPLPRPLVFHERVSLRLDDDNEIAIWNSGHVTHYYTVDYGEGEHREGEEVNSAKELLTILWHWARDSGHTELEQALEVWVE